MGLLNAYSIKHWSFERNDWAHLFFSLFEIFVLNILFSSFVLQQYLYFSLHYVIVIKYANIFCL